MRLLTYCPKSEQLPSRDRVVELEISGIGKLRNRLVKT